MGSPCPSNTISFDNIAIGDIIQPEDVNQLQSGTQEAEARWSISKTVFNPVYDGEIITAEQIIQVQTALEQMNGCTCNCNNIVTDPKGPGCTCQCNYCTCQCNYCTCQCNNCTCNCDYSCTCNCDHCICDNNCLCNGNSFGGISWWLIMAQFDQIEVGEIITTSNISQLQQYINLLLTECVCNCNYCTCDCNYSCTCQCNITTTDPLGTGCTCQCNYCTCQSYVAVYNCKCDSD